MKNPPLFKSGDVVHLKSGGPNMTILEDNNNTKRTYLVGWFNSNGDYSGGQFEEAALLLTDKREFEPVLHKMPHDFSVI